MQTAEQLILDRAQADFEEGVDWIRHRLRERHSAVVARALELGVIGAVSTLQLRPRYREDVEFLFVLARRVAAGEDPRAIADETLPRVLRMRELKLVARTRDAAFVRILDLAGGMFAARLPDLARMLSVGEADTYPALVRQAFSDPDHVVDFIEENRKTMRAIMDVLEENPRILRLPHAWVQQIVDTSRDVIEWEAERLEASVRAMYGK